MLQYMMTLSNSCFLPGIQETGPVNQQVAIDLANEQVLPPTGMVQGGGAIDNNNFEGDLQIQLTDVNLQEQQMRLALDMRVEGDTKEFNSVEFAFDLRSDKVEEVAEEMRQELGIPETILPKIVNLLSDQIDKVEHELMQHNS